MWAKEWEQSILETHMLCITQKLCCLYFTVLSWYKVSLSFSSYFLRGTFNVLVPASIWRWPAQQYSSTFAFKCCRLSYLPIRAISILADVAIKSVANANYPMQVCLIIFQNLLGSTKTGFFVCRKGICSCHLKLGMRQTWVAKIFHHQIAICETEA